MVILFENYVSEILRILSESLLQGSSSIAGNTSSVADIQIGLNDLIAGLNNFDCSRLDSLLFKSSQDPSTLLNTSLCASPEDCSRTLRPERHVVRRNLLDNFEETTASHSTVENLAQVNDGVVTTPQYHGKVLVKEGQLVESKRSSQESLSVSMVKRTWIEGEMEKEEKQVVSDRLDEKGKFKVTQSVRVTRHVLPITEIVELVGEDSIRVSELCSRRVVEVSVEEEVDVRPKTSQPESGGEILFRFCENVKESTVQGRRKVSIRSGSSSFSESSSDELAVSGDLVVSPRILTDVEVTAELLPGKSLKTRRIVRTRSSSLPSSE